MSYIGRKTAVRPDCVKSYKPLACVLVGDYQCVLASMTRRLDFHSLGVM